MTTEIIAHRFLAPARNDKASGFIFPNQILRFTQNDSVMEIVSKAPPTTFFVKMPDMQRDDRVRRWAVLDVLPIVERREA